MKETHLPHVTHVPGTCIYVLCMCTCIYHSLRPTATAFVFHVCADPALPHGHRVGASGPHPQLQRALGESHAGTRCGGFEDVHDVYSMFDTCFLLMWLTYFWSSKRLPPSGIMYPESFCLGHDPCCDRGIRLIVGLGTDAACTGSSHKLIDAASLVCRQ